MAGPAPTISIVTICFNSEEYIRDTLESVRQQTQKPHELILIDGASTDRTNEIIRQFGDIVSLHLSEPDDGIADAMNKGLQRATGDYVMFLHSDDFLVNNTVLEDIGKHLEAECDINAFDMIFRKEGGDRRLKPRRLDWRTRFKTPYLHPATLCHRRLFEAIGTFDTGFRIAMDYDFFLRAYMNGARETYAPVVTTVMRDTGISSQNDWPDLKTRFAEERKIHQKYSESFLMKAVYAVYWVAYLSFRRTRKALLGY